MNEEKTAATPLKTIQTTSTSNQELSAFTSVSGFELVQRMAQGLMTATLIPKIYRENIGDTMIAINMAQRLRCDPLMVMQNLYVVHGSPAWSGQFVIAAINQSGMFKGPLRFNEVGERDTMTWGYYAEATSKDDHVIKGPTVTMQIAKNEGWIAKNPKWVNIPEMMLRYRAGSWFGRTECPELLMGFQSAEENVDTIDIDPETGEVINEYAYAPAPRAVKRAVKAETLQKAAKPRPDTVVSESPKVTPGPVKEKVVETPNSGPTTVGTQPVEATVVQDGEVIGTTQITPHTTVEVQLKEKGWYEDSNRKFNAHGEIWNTDIHAKSSKDGNPIINTDGHFRVRRGGPLPGAVEEVIPEATQPEATEPVPVGTPTVGYQSEPEFIDGPDSDPEDDWAAGLE